MTRVLSERDYERVLELQRDLAERVAAGAEPATLLLVEHDAVVTVGRGNQRDAAGAVRGAPAPADADPARFPGRRVVRVERGGGVTYHGPGQLVGYPIVRLEDRDVRGFLRRLEMGLIRALADFGLEGRAREEATGVWVGARKVASIGIAVRRWTTLHGFALNVATDLTAFAGLDPCGFDASVMTSLSRELSRELAVDDVRETVARAVVGALGP